MFTFWYLKRVRRRRKVKKRRRRRGRQREVRTYGAGKSPSACVKLGIALGTWRRNFPLSRKKNLFKRSLPSVQETSSIKLFFFSLRGTATHDQNDKNIPSHFSLLSSLLRLAMWKWREEGRKPLRQRHLQDLCVCECVQGSAYRCIPFLYSVTIQISACE